MTRSAARPERPIATVGALVMSQRERLLFIRTHKWRNTWGVPGGKIEYGESMHDALVREFREETGLTIHDIRVGPVQEAIESEEFHRPAHFILLNFLARSSSEHVRLNDEAQAYAWLTAKEAATLDLNSYTRRLLAFFRDVGFAAPALMGGP